MNAMIRVMGDWWAVLFVVLVGIHGGPVGQPVWANDERPFGLPRIPGNVRQGSTEEISLGKKLFFDKRLSVDKTVSCGSCHDPKQGWADGLKVAKGVAGKKGPRNSPTVVNVVYFPTLFWDGRAKSLEEQIRGPIESPIEMGHSLPKLAEQLASVPDYKTEFQKAYARKVEPELIVKAIAAFVRSLRAGNAPFDRYRAGDQQALSPSARRGHRVFFFRSNCSTCHRAPLFTDHEFHNLGVGVEAEEPDLGRYAVSELDVDRSAFKTPSLRDVHRTAPYMHDGRFKTLEEVVDFYAEGGKMNPQLDPLMNVIPLSDQEKKDLVRFLREGLASQDYPDGK